MQTWIAFIVVVFAIGTLAYYTINGFGGNIPYWPTIGATTLVLMFLGIYKK